MDAIFEHFESIHTAQPSEVSADLSAFWSSLLARQTEYFAATGRFTAELSQELSPGNGLSFYSIPCFNPDYGNWYETDIQWSENGVQVYQSFWMDGTPISAKCTVEQFGQ